MQKFNKLKYNEIETKKISEFESSFVLKPLERGFGNTLGNALRRVVLSSISGVAPFAVKIKGADHEFQTLARVTEDVVALILNIKTLKFVYDREIFQDDEVIKVSLKSPKGEVTAKNMTMPAGVELVDPDHYVGTATEVAGLELELFLTVGRGFRTYEENKELIKKYVNKIESSITLGSLIAIDSDFSPVDKVSYESVELNSSSAIIEEKLTINIKTDGSVDAKDAIAQGAQILSTHLGIVADVANLDKEEIFEEFISGGVKDDKRPMSITALDLSVRSYNCLKRAELETVEDLAKLTKREIQEIKNLGAKSVDEIIAKLAEIDILLKDSE
ncbi:DNA-directed RNA polymerase subunit alpha [Candidatus Mycoplasma mahonii]|uniref:DNA-directed RNA polymerase subunit alpha n=1 Tax=Candidatus Mycoplasma mahonii TaxID=3004105 RepID=UPI0026F2A7CB|nr:DNA-directed RNA polymerase subunit alpha [Candidatus Mycoplasma mahonii]WKX02297.1 DNA-directed RNA polymerase subunit alpha [Candidatus Mycoplasma mahonii]